MSKRNLVTALAAALENSPKAGRNADITGKTMDPPGADFLLVALRNSATGRDQIMQRRLGALADIPVS